MSLKFICGNHNNPHNIFSQPRVSKYEDSMKLSSHVEFNFIFINKPDIFVLNNLETAIFRQTYDITDMAC